MRAAFQWLDSHPPFYWGLAVAATLALLAWITYSVWRAARDRPLRWATAGFAGLLLLFLAAWRWPTLFSASEYNPDESQFIAGAMALARDPVFWRSVDGVTSGPLDFYALLPLHLLGLPLDYFGARLTALLLLWAMLLLLHRAFRAHAASGVAQLGVLPAAVFFATATHVDFVHYSSEITPLALLALALGLSARQPLIAAFAAGCLPWAKLQAAPFAAVVAGWLGWQAWRAGPGGGRDWRRLLQVAVASAAPTALSLVLVAASGQLGHFYRRFILQNIAYVQAGTPFGKVLRELVRFATESGLFFPWLFAALGFLGVLVTMHLRQRADPPPQSWRELTQHAHENGLIVSWIAAALLFLLGSGAVYVKRREALPARFWLGAALTATALVCIAAPSRSSLHYLLFLTVPLTYWSGVLLCDLWARGAARLTLAGLATILAVVPVAVRLQGPPPAMLGKLASHWRHPHTQLGVVLRHWREPGAHLALWGWRSDAYVDSGLPQATQDSVSQWCIMPVPLRDYYRATYLADIQRTQPEVFVDAVGPGAPFFFNRAEQAHEIFPELAGFIRRHYLPVVDLEEARVYVRNDVLARRPLSPAELRRLIGEGRVEFGPPVPPASSQPANLPGNRVDGQLVLMVEPPAELTWPLAGSERSFQIEYGFHPQAYTEGVTDGAEFIVELRMPGQPALQVFHRLVDPLHQPEDRGRLLAAADLPPYPPGTSLVVRTAPGRNADSAWDWLYFSSLRFAHSPVYSVRQFPGFYRVPSRLDCTYPYLVRHDADWLLMLPPPAALTFVVDGDERQLNFSFGLAEGSYTPPGQTDGAIFVVELLSPGREPRTIYRRRLDPGGQPADRGVQSADLMLPADLRPGDRLVLRIDPGGNASWDWTYVSALDLR